VTTHVYKSNEPPENGGTDRCIECGVEVVYWIVKIRAVSADGKKLPLSEASIIEYRRPGGAWQSERIPCREQFSLFGASADG
jgi:hypothetical protein